jgi:hypothetical protein
MALCSLRRVKGLGEYEPRIPIHPTFLDRKSVHSWVHLPRSQKTMSSAPLATTSGERRTAGLTAGLSISCMMAGYCVGQPAEKPPVDSHLGSAYPWGPRYRIHDGGEGQLSKEENVLGAADLFSGSRRAFRSPGPLSAAGIFSSGAGSCVML